jgi:hypothetical protein
MRDLGAGVDTGIGATGADHVDRVCGDEGQRRFDRTLHRPSFAQALPSAEVGAVVLDAEGVAHGSGSGTAVVLRGVGIVAGPCRQVPIRDA